MKTRVASLTAGGASNPITTNSMTPEPHSFNPAQSNPSLS
jgi:hypothetical protein